jgi:hypothetical protein
MSAFGGKADIRFVFLFSGEWPRRDFRLFIKCLILEQYVGLGGRKAWPNRISSWCRQPP